MKIGTLTCHRVHNHGAMLQAWALVSYLRQLGHDASIIDYTPDYLTPSDKFTIGNPRYKHAPISWLYFLAKMPEYKRNKERFDSFAAFDEKWIKPLRTPSRYYDSSSLIDANDFDAYIAGSDQIWNTEFNNGRDKAFYLSFAPSGSVKVSYAACFATEQIADGWSEFVSNGLQNFDNISVREESGLQLLNSLGFNGELVVDPVFLIPAELWIKTFECDSMPNDNHIVVYDFQKESNIKDIALRLRALTGCKICSVGPWKTGYADIEMYASAPDEFVRVISNARCVISNSFHGSAFSMIFRRNFFVVKRDDGLNRRMIDLLSRYGLANRLIDTTVDDKLLTSDIDYIGVSEMLQHDIDSSKLWLENVLSR